MSLKAFERFQQFKLTHKRGADAPKLVDHIILAEFDIDSGSTVRHKYPCAVPGYSDDWFAEYMLPEGAHNHSLDWTVMFLNKGRPALDENFPAGPADASPENGGSSGNGGSGGGSGGSGGGGSVAAEGSSNGAHAGAADDKEKARTGSFLYCINLVRKKDDPTVRRGAVVKAMAVCSRYHFIEMFRPLLIIALDQYYQQPDPVVLKDLFDALNAADMSQVPRPTPWERRLMRRGVASRPLGSVPVEHLQQKWTHTMSFAYGAQTVQAVIPLHTCPDETLTPSLTLLVSAFGPATMKIYNAVLTGQRVLFVGYNHAAGDVCKFVLAACAMVSPPLEGVMHRAFPYANLSDLSFLETPNGTGFVAGVTNPMFEARTEWWDLLCQLDLPNGTGTAITAEEKASADSKKTGAGATPPRAPNSSGGGGGAGGAAAGGASGAAKTMAEQLWYEEDGPFVAKLAAAISNSTTTEQWVRGMFHEYTSGLADLVLDGESGVAEQLSAAARAEHEHAVAANGWRLRQLRRVARLDAPGVANPWKGLTNEPLLVSEGAKLRALVRRLQLEEAMEAHDVREALEELDRCLQSEAALQVLLGSLMPESKGGVYLLGAALMHTDQRARRHAFNLLQRMELYESTRPAVQCMNHLFVMTLTRLQASQNSFN